MPLPVPQAVEGEPGISEAVISEAVISEAVISEAVISEAVISEAVNVVVRAISACPEGANLIYLIDLCHG
jgi:hypothetical protein